MMLRARITAVALTACAAALAATHAGGSAVMPRSVATFALAAQPDDSSAVRRSSVGVPDLRGRLTALDPADPMAYFELAEEVAFEIRAPAGQRLARELFVLAFEIDRRSPEPLGLGPSVALALADLAATPAERRWLRTLAAALAAGDAAEPDARPAALPRLAPSDAATPEEDAITLALMLSDALAGEGRRVRDAVVRLAERSNLPIDPEQSRFDRGYAEVRRIAAAAGVSDNDAFVAARALADAIAGLGGEDEPMEAIEAVLRVQAQLAGAAASTWGGQRRIDRGAPLYDVTPDTLAATFDIDPRRTVWRPAQRTDPLAGEWVTPSDD
jgi:hypothetical protein